MHTYTERFLALQAKGRVLDESVCKAEGHEHGTWCRAAAAADPNDTEAAEVAAAENRARDRAWRRFLSEWVAPAGGAGSGGSPRD